MNDRERLIACVKGLPVDRPPYYLFWGPWDTTWNRWRSEGMPNSLQSFDDVKQMFGSDPIPTDYVVPVNLGPCPLIEKTILSEDEKEIVFIDSWGIKRRDLKTITSMSQFLEFPVKNRKSWELYKEKWLNPEDPRRLEGNWREICNQWMAKGYPIQLGWYPDAGVFGPFRWLMGDEEGLVAFHSMPDLVHEIMDHITTIYLSVFEQVVNDVQVDVIHFWEDISYKGGPLISPKFWESFVGPNYLRIKAFADQHDIMIISVDTDGNPDKITPPMLRSGVNLLYPMEVAAGCDVNQWQAKYPTLAIMGGFDKRVLSRGYKEIDQEIERLRPAVEKGRYIPELDHLVPDDVSWENYCYYALALKKLVGKI